MVERPKYLEMTLSQLKSYVESLESNVLLVVEFPKEDQKDGLGEIKSKTMSQHAVIFLQHVVANRVKIGYTVSIELYINNLLRGWYKICLKNSR